MQRLLVRLGWLCLAIGMLAIVPLPDVHSIDAVPGIRNALLALLTVGGIGKILYDTLFFDHYRQ